MFVLIIMVKMNARSMRPMSKERKIEIKRESRSSHQQDQGIKQAAAAAAATQPLSPRSQRLTAPTVPRTLKGSDKCYGTPIATSSSTFQRFWGGRTNDMARLLRMNNLETRAGEPFSPSMECSVARPASDDGNLFFNPTR